MKKSLKYLLFVAGALLLASCVTRGETPSDSSSEGIPASSEEESSSSSSSSSSIDSSSSSQSSSEDDTINYDIAYELNGGTINSGLVDFYTYGVGAILPTDVTKEGCTFKGWYISPTFEGSRVLTISSSDSGDKIYYAKWSANKYTISYELNGGSINEGEVTQYTYGVGATLPTDVTKPHESFDGWFTTSSFEGGAVTEISTTDIGDKTFYAKWTVNYRTVSFYDDNGVLIDNVSTYRDGDNVVFPTSWIASGDHIVGWKKDNSGAIVTSATVEGDASYYAVINLNTYQDQQVSTNQTKLFVDRYDNRSVYFETDATFGNEWGKPGLKVVDKNGKAFIFTSWNSPLFFLYDSCNNSFDPEFASKITFTAASAVKDANHTKIGLKVIYDYENETFYFKTSSFEENGQYTIFNGFQVTLTDIEAALGVNYDFSKIKFGLYTHYWGDNTTAYSNIRADYRAQDINDAINEVIDLANQANPSYLNGQYSLVGNTRAYFTGASSSIYLKTQLKLNNAHQGISIYINKNKDSSKSIIDNESDCINSQIGFQHYGYSVMENYGYNTPSKMSGIYQFNNLLGIDTYDEDAGNPGERTVIVEYFIHEGKLYITYDGTNLFDKPLTLSDINDAFTADADYHIGLHNFEGTKTLKATVLDYKVSGAAINKYKEVVGEPLQSNVIDLYLVAGQSNAAGYSANPESPEVFENVGYAGAADYFLDNDYYRSSYLTSYQNYLWSVTKGLGEDQYHIGPEYGMAKVLNNQYNGETKALIFKSAAGGTSLLDKDDNGSHSFGNWYPRSMWDQGYTPDPYNSNDPTGVQYYLFIENFRSVYNTLVAEGYTPVVKGMAWMQGCDDLGQPNEYEPLLHTLISDLRTDLGQITGSDLSDMPFIIGEIATTFGQYNNPAVPAFNEMQRRVANEEGESVITVPTSDLIIVGEGDVIHGTDRYHFNAADATTLGERFANAMNSINTCTITFKKPNGDTISSQVVSINQNIAFPTGWEDTGYQASGWKLNNAGEAVTVATATEDATYYAVVSPIVTTVTFTGLGVDQQIQATYGVGLSESIPTPTVVDIYNTTYSTGDSIDYIHLTSNATVTYSLSGNAASYVGGTYTLNKGAKTKLYNTDGTFSISADFTAAEDSGHKTNSKLGFVIYDSSDEWLAINLFGTQAINFSNASGGMGWNSDGQNLFDNLSAVYTDANPEFNFKLIYDDDAKCFVLVFNEDTSNEQVRYVYISKINAFTGVEYDFSTAKVGLFNHSWGADGSLAENVAVDKVEASVLTETYYRSYANVTKTSGQGQMYKERFESSVSYETTVTSMSNSSDKPGLKIQDASAKSFVLTSWDGNIFYIVDGDNTSNPGDVGNIKLTCNGLVKDSTHLSFKIKAIYDANNEVFYFKISSGDTYSVVNCFTVSLADIESALGVDYNLSKYRIGVYTHAWGSSVTYSNTNFHLNGQAISSEILEITTIGDSSSSYKNGKYTLVGTSVNYFSGSSSSVYLKAKYEFGSVNQGITISAAGQNAQIGFQHRGYCILQDVLDKGWNVPSKMSGNAFVFNGLLDVDVPTSGTHDVEWFINDGKLYVAIDGTNYFTHPLDLSLVNDAFTPGASYSIGLFNWGTDGDSNVYTLRASEVELKLGAAAIEAYRAEAGLEPQTHYIDLYLIAGQSNAAGYTRHNDTLTETFDNIGYAGGVDYFANDNCYRTSNLDSYTSYLSSVKAGLGQDYRYIGPEYGMAKTLNDQYDGETKALIFKTAAGGTSLRNELSNDFGNWYPRSMWENGYTPDALNRNDKTGLEYYLFVENFRSVYNNLVANGYTPVVKGMAWMQGCADLGHDDEYETLLHALIADIRSDLSSITGADLSEMPFVIGEIATTFGGYENPAVPSFNEMQRRVANDEGSSVVTVPTADLILPGTDNYHFNTADAVTLGQRFAAAINSINSVTITFKKPNGDTISSQTVGVNQNIVFPTGWEDTGYVATGWKLNNEGAAVTAATATNDATYYAVVEPLTINVSFSGLGVNENLNATYGEGLSGSEPTPNIDIYNTTYSTGSGINYSTLLNDASVTYSLDTNNVTYDAANNRYTLYQYSWAKLHNSEDSFSISADFTAAGDTKTYSKLGFYLVDSNNNWLGIDLFGNNVINFANASTGGNMGWNSDGQGLFNNLSDVYTNEDPDFNFKLVYDKVTNAFYLIFNEGTPNEQARILYVDRVNEITGTNYDFSTAQVGLYNHGWGTNGCLASNVTFNDDDESIYNSDYLLIASNVSNNNSGVTNNGDGTYTITANNAKYAMDATSGSFSASATFAQSSGAVVTGFRLYDKNGKSLGFYDWGGSTGQRYWINGYDNTQPTNNTFMPGPSGAVASTSFTLHLQYNAATETFTVWDERPGDAEYKYNFTLTQLEGDAQHGAYDFSEIYICLGSGTTFGHDATVSNYSFVRL